MFGKFGKGRDRTKKLEMLANAPIGAGTSVNGRRGVIKGTLLLSEDGDRWIEHLVEHQDGERLWVAVENFDRTRATLWSDVEVWDVKGGPDDKSITYNGQSFRRNESGTVSYTSKGEVDLFASGTIDYVDFNGPDNMRIGFERFGEEGAGRRRRATSGLCPNCHAPLHADAANKCSSCGSDLMADHGHWGSWEVALGVDVTDSAGLQ
ncbi:MAG: DUF4178 domain-containing protein [Acidimicrobiales bacterium]